MTARRSETRGPLVPCVGKRSGILRCALNDTRTGADATSARMIPPQAARTAHQDEVERLLAAHRLPQRLAIFFLAVEFGGAIAIASGLRDDLRHAIAELFVVDFDFFLL